MNDIFELLVYSRILSLESKITTYKNKDIFFKKNDFSLKDLYHSLNYSSSYKFEILKLVWDNPKLSYQRDTSLTYYDTTNYY